jgi:hypothetical protein
MALKVQVTTPQSTRVRITPVAPINVDIARFRMEPIKLEELLNVDSLDGLDTGDMVIYNEATQTWDVVPESDQHNPDGGIY